MTNANAQQLPKSVVVGSNPPGFERMVATARPGHHLEEMRAAGRLYGDKGVQSRPIHVHGIDFVSSDGMFGVFFGHNFISTEGEPECVDG